MQKIAALVTLGLVGWGIAAGGILGALTGLLAGIAGGTGLSIMLGERETEVKPASTTMGKAQRIGGALVLIATVVGLYLGGWRMGWLYVLGGSVLAMLLSLVTAKLTGGLRSGQPT